MIGYQPLLLFEIFTINMGMRILLLLLAALPFSLMAQDNVWERPEEPIGVNPDAKYLKGAVPEVDGKVCFSATVKAAGMNKAAIFSKAKDFMQKLTTGREQLELSRTVLADEEKMQIVNNMQEWLVFKNSAFVTDKTKLSYLLIVDCRDGEATITMTRISYLYEEERNPQTYLAEEWINDKYGLNKKQNKLARLSGKFRRKTIDRKDFIFSRFETEIQQ